MKQVFLSAYRLRTYAFALGVLLLVIIAFTAQLELGAAGRTFRFVASLIGVALLALSFFLIMFGPSSIPETVTRTVRSPVRGRWLALNSPTTKEPSHGIRAYGQAFAIDLVHDPVESPRPQFGSGKHFRESTDYPAFEQPVYAMVSGTVVRATDWRRDHRARSSGLSVVYMMIEGMIRELGGPGFVIGNHVTIRTDDGVYALVAHIRQGSSLVSAGDLVRAGEPVALCGNSGNSSEPHVHAQLMDRANPLTAQGLPMTFAGVAALPANGEPLNLGQ